MRNSVTNKQNGIVKKTVFRAMTKTKGKRFYIKCEHETGNENEYVFTHLILIGLATMKN